jgi:hypothetical protein
MPHGDDAAGSAALCPDEDDEPAAQVTGGDKAIFAIVVPVVALDGMTAGKHQVRVREVEAAVLQDGVALRRVELDVHGYL